MTKRLIKIVLVLLCVAGYGVAEARGWAFGGRQVPERIAPDQLRSSSPGSWHYVYWAHGSRGK